MACQLDYHDAGISGQGVQQVLANLARSPKPCSDLILSHNPLGDLGVCILATSLPHFCITALSLSSTGISDAGLQSIIVNLLSHRPVLKTLILSSNNIKLKGKAPALLAKALSQPQSSLQHLSLNANTLANTVYSLLQNLTLTSLARLSLNTCELTADDAKAIAAWLAQPRRTGTLEILELSGNFLGVDEKGTGLLASVLLNRNTSLLHLEMHANDQSPAPPQLPFTEDSQTSPAPDPFFDSLANIQGIKPPDIQLTVTGALNRNRLIKRNTRTAACKVLNASRIILNAHFPQSSPTDIRKLVETLSLSSSPDTLNHAFRSSTIPKLPQELVWEILRAIPDAYDLLVVKPQSSFMESALSQTQLTRIWDFAISRETLKEGRRLNAEARDWFLRQTGCERFFNG